ncbi:hypothetical protein PybrP1_012678 [[Pythium] brassicae (nom. inval.)]|nr:hypothetical protein PybrP1_012678 [[Pythium] brassicae (nom. inval.)]
MLRVSAAIAIALLAPTADAGAASCDLTKLFSAAQPLQSSGGVAACVAATGYELLPPVDPPTDAQLAKFCAASPCTLILDALQKTDIPDCPVAMLGGVSIKQVFAVITAKCRGGAAAPVPATSAASTPTPTVTPAKPQAPTPAVTPASTPTAATAGVGLSGTPANAKSEPTLEPQMCE